MSMVSARPVFCVCLRLLVLLFFALALTPHSFSSSLLAVCFLLPRAGVQPPW
jgi:hypothetical protein